MTDVEERLRAGLTGLAEAVPASQHAWAEHERRLAARRPRRGAVFAAVAAAVVVAAAVPATVLPHPTSPPVAGPAPTSTPPPVSTTPPTASFDPEYEGPYLGVVTGAAQIEAFTEGGTRWGVWIFVDRRPNGQGWTERLCVVAVPVGQPLNGPVRHPNSSGCQAVPAASSKVSTRTVLGGSTPGSGPLPHVLLFVTTVDVASLEVREAMGAPVQVSQFTRTDQLAVYIADFPTSYEGFGYTARDAAGNVVEQAIT
jgi:hypothetical protein